jgi:hypothetical protein
MSGGVEIVTLSARPAALRDWLGVQPMIHAADAVYIRPMDFLEKKRLSRKHRPFFQTGEAEFFLAYRGGHCVGRVSAQVNQRAREWTEERVGHFGFFDAIDDQGVAAALLGAARGWLAARGATRLRGPFNLSINEECGVQVSGFHEPRAYLMPQSMPFTGALLEGQGLAKAMDLFAYRIARGRDASRLDQLLAMTGSAASGLAARPVDMAHFRRDVGILADIFNDAWSGNWGFVPFSAAEIDAMAADLRPIYKSRYGVFLELSGEPVAVAIGVPNINAFMAGAGGKLLSLAGVRFAWNLLTKRAPHARVPLAGLRRRFHGGPMGAALLARLVQELRTMEETFDFEWIELSWLLETNRAVIKVAEAAGGVRATVHRLYEGPIAPGS